jgi:RNA polymerase sigma-70 factor, ECF subfamily
LELRDLQRALAKLATEQREVILLVGLEGFAYEEVAEVLGVLVGTTRQLRYRCSAARSAQSRAARLIPSRRLHGSPGLVSHFGK